MKQAEQTLEQRRLAYEDARVQEIVGLQAADLQIVTAQRELTTVQAGATALELTQAEASVDQARANLEKLRQPVKETDIAQAEAVVEQARANLSKLQRAVDSQEITQVRASLSSAQATLSELRAGPKATDLATALASVKQAAAARDVQRLKLEQASLLAPYSGVIAMVAAVPGQPVSASSSLVTIVDDSSLTVDVNVAEADIAKVKLDQIARASFTALPGKIITGTVVAITPKATVQSNVVSYLVTVTLGQAVEAGVKTGMTATVTIVTERLADVLIVPNRAIQTQGQQKVVTLQGQGATAVMPVEVGLVGDSRSAILSGLKEGDVIVVTAITGTTATRTTGNTGLGIPGIGGPPAGAPPK
jgi:HlyD family secretion protein